MKKNIIIRLVASWDMWFRIWPIVIWPELMTSPERRRPLLYTIAYSQQIVTPIYYTPLPNTQHITPTQAKTTHSNIQHKDTQHTDIQHTNIPHSNTKHTYIQHTYAQHTYIQHTYIQHTYIIIQHTYTQHTTNMQHTCIQQTNSPIYNTQIYSTPLTEDLGNCQINKCLLPKYSNYVAKCLAFINIITSMDKFKSMLYTCCKIKFSQKTYMLEIYNMFIVMSPLPYF